MVSLSAQEIILEYFCPAAGMVMANFMFMAPLSDVRKAAAAGTLGDLNPIPWAVMLGNTLGWVSYGLLLTNWFIFFANAPGFLLSLYFNVTAVKLLHAASLTEAIANQPSIPTTTAPLLSEKVDLKKKNDQNDKDTHHVDDSRIEATLSTVLVVDSLDIPLPVSMSLSNKGTTVAPETVAQQAPLSQSVITMTTTKPMAAIRLQNLERLILFMVVLWMGVLSCIVSAKSWDEDLKQMVTGLTVNGNLLFFYGAPLSTVRQVLQTRSSRWLHGPTMCRNTFNGVFWTAYGLAVLDPYVAVPNGMGALLGVVQMMLWIVFPRKGKSQQQLEEEAPSNEHADLRIQSEPALPVEP